jgi:integrin beta 3
MDVMVDREGQLVFTMSDGRMKNVGLVIGKDGEPGRDGVNGAPGKDGVDGIGFDDLDLVENDAGVFLRCVRGENVKEWRLPVMRYRGVFKDGQVYRKGDTVTWGGSLWHCDADGTDDKPDGATKSWTLASKRGRDGKDGVMKPAPKPGPVKVS